MNCPLIEKYVDFDDVRNIFYNLSDSNIKNIQYVSLSDYSVVYGDFVIGLRYTTEKDENYYMFISANSRFAPPQQIAIGKALEETVYLMQECYPNPSVLNFVAFPESSINTKTKGFVPRSYRDSASSNEELSIDTMSEKTQKCFENGVQACKIFSGLLNDYNESVESKKRKKLNL